MPKQIHQLTSLGTNPANGNMFAVDTGTVTRSLTFGTLAKNIIENYNGSTIDGKTQTVQAALNSVTGALNGAEVRKVLTGAAIGAQASGAGDMGLTIYGKSTQTGTPSPSSHAEITNVGDSGSVELRVAGKNLIAYPYHNSSQTISGVTLTVNADGSVRVRGTSTAKVDFILMERPALMNTLIVGQRYRVTSYDGGNNNGPVNDCWVQVYSDMGVDGSSWQEFTWLGSNNAANIEICVGSGRTVDTVVYPMVQIVPSVNGSYIDTDATYQPYTGSSVSLTTTGGLCGLPVTSGGNYIDASGQHWICDTIDKATGKLTKRCGKIVLDGTLTYTRANDGTFYLRISDLIHATNYSQYIICDGLETVARNGLVVSTANSISGFLDSTEQYPNSNWLYFSVENVSTVDALTTYLTSNPITVVYALNAPVETAIDSLDGVQSYDGGTSVYTTDAAQPDLRAKIFVDAAAYI